MVLLWSTIESTIALIAVCLPVVYGLFGRHFVDSIIRSIHSLRSLGSRGSSGMRSHRDASEYNTLAAAEGWERHGSEASGRPIVPAYVEPSSVETIAMKDQEGAEAAKVVKNGEINVSKTVSQMNSAI